MVTEWNIPKLPPGVSLIQEGDEDLMFAYLYMVLTREYGWTNEQYAEAVGRNPSTVFRARKRWQKDGTFEKVARILLEPIMEDVVATDRMALAERSKLIERAIEIAKGEHGSSPRTSLEAIAWLEEMIFRPLMDQQEEAGAKELSYAKKAERVMPTNIERPKFLKAGSAAKRASSDD